MVELDVNKELPVITTNFEIVKESLINNIARYKNIVVTEEGLKECKADLRSLASMRNKIDSFRKEVKRELTEPITKFEDNCKELIKLIENAEPSLKAGIEVFDQKKRDEKKVQAEDVISNAITEHGLNEKYASRLNVLDKYTNLSSKISDVKTDIEQRCFILLQEQEREIEVLRLEEERKAEMKRLEEERKAEVLAIAKNTLDESNKNIKNKMCIEDFETLIKNGISTLDIIKEINKRKDRIFLEENPQNESEPIKTQEKPKESQANSQVFSQANSQDYSQQKNYYVEMRVESTKEKIMMLSQFLKTNGYEYKKLADGVI